jgi:anaerobic glycerol-3-phosphate dehydrogenase
MQGVASALPPEVVIVGGGIGGLTAALALLKPCSRRLGLAFSSAQTAPASFMLSA